MRVAAQGKIDLANNRAVAQEQGSSTRHQFWSILYMTPCTSKLPNNRAAGSSTRQNITRKYTHNSHSSQIKDSSRQYSTVQHTIMVLWSTHKLKITR